MQSYRTPSDSEGMPGKRFSRIPLEYWFSLTVLIHTVTLARCQDAFNKTV